ncbi:MAG: hypothetical protein ACI8PB_003682 [Desulforhopalus sp.]|jgi:hypothetical protein
MKAENHVVYWITDSLLLDAKSKFLRANSVPISLPGSKFVMMLRAQQAVIHGYDPIIDDTFSNLQLYRVAKRKVVDTEATLEQQGFSDGEVLVIILGPSGLVFSAIDSQEFPMNIDPSLAPANTAITLTEIHMSHQEKS